MRTTESNHMPVVRPLQGCVGIKCKAKGRAKGKVKGKTKGKALKARA